MAEKPRQEAGIDRKRTKRDAAYHRIAPRVAAPGLVAEAQRGATRREGIGIGGSGGAPLLPSHTTGHAGPHPAVQSVAVSGQPGDSEAIEVTPGKAICIAPRAAAHQPPAAVMAGALQDQPLGNPPERPVRGRWSVPASTALVAGPSAAVDPVIQRRKDPRGLGPGGSTPSNRADTAPGRPRSALGCARRSGACLARMRCFSSSRLAARRGVSLRAPVYPEH